ncbi:hypothetical protein AB4Z39_11600 [Mycobacterium adipatum]|uniref:hypothetical protein n=1 Tax=Mycobacterium adipatum TaxID=1682113 RepID=UPI0034E06D3E
MAANPEVEKLLRARFGIGTSDFVNVLERGPWPCTASLNDGEGRLVDATFPDDRQGVLAAGAEIAVHVAHLCPSAFKGRNHRWGIG